MDPDSALVSALGVPAVLLAPDFTARARSGPWAETQGPGDRPLTARPGLADMVHEALSSGALHTFHDTATGTEWEAHPIQTADELQVLVIARGAPTSSGGVHRRVFEASSRPMLIVGPRGRILHANAAATQRGVCQWLADVSESAAGAVHLRDALERAERGVAAGVTLDSGARVELQPLVAGLVLAEIAEAEADPAPIEEWVAAGSLDASFVYEARTELNALVGHLELLHETPLSRLQEARLEYVTQSALDLARQFGGGAGAPGPADGLRPPRTIPEPPDGAESLRVLVVDDNEVNLHVVLSMLNVIGVRAESAQSGTAALDKMAESGPFDLVLMDVVLPDTDGVEATRAIRERYGDGPVVVGLTALPDARERCLAAGMNTFLAKPVRLREISEVVAASVAS